MASGSNPWTWSAPHKDYYYVALDSTGTQVYHWAKDRNQIIPQSNDGPTGNATAIQAPVPAQQKHIRRDSESAGREDKPASPAAQRHTALSADAAIKASQPSFSTAGNNSSTPAHTYSYPQTPQPTSSQQSYSVSTSGYTQLQHSSQLQQVNHERLDPATAGQRPRRHSSQEAAPASNTAQMAPGIPPSVRPNLPGLIAGTPQRGWYENLDSSYRMRTGYEAHQFFKKGRVFSVLWAEAASETAARQAFPFASTSTVAPFRNPYNRPEYTQGRFGQVVYSNIRRFVVVQVKPREHFVYACPITTYSGRGTTKPGCNPSEHTIVHFKGTTPQYIRGEYQMGMTKTPIAVIPADASETMDPASRLRFGKTFPVEWNVKVKEIGMVERTHLDRMIQYWRDEERKDDQEEEENGGQPPTIQE